MSPARHLPLRVDKEKVNTEIKGLQVVAATIHLGSFGSSGPNQG
jgi:hypothetical protein